MINHHFWAPRQNGGGDRPRKVQFWKLQNSCDLDFGSSRGLTGAHIRSRFTTHQIRLKSEKLFVDVRTDVWTNTSSSMT